MGPTQFVDDYQLEQSRHFVVFEVDSGLRIVVRNCQCSIRTKQLDSEDKYTLDQQQIEMIEAKLEITHT